MKVLSTQEIKCISGAVSHDLQEDKKQPQAQQQPDADYAWLGLATIVSLLFAGWYKFK
jgi:hypothetical protein